jgi:antitoxin (DNA-binding transcriptional repressor) of toxin-antitoxin stability system
MHHIMAKATVRQLRYHFREIEDRLNKGEEIELYKRKKMIGRLVPARLKSEEYPDFAALSKRIFGRKKMKKTGTQLVSEERGDY